MTFPSAFKIPDEFVIVVFLFQLFLGCQFDHDHIEFVYIFALPQNSFVVLFKLICSYRS